MDLWVFLMPIFCFFIKNVLLFLLEKNKFLIMKKIETKKEEKNVNEMETKKIDELYGKKISARKNSTDKKEIPLKPLRKEDVLKKNPAYISSEINDEGDLIDEKEVSQKKTKKTAALKNSERTVKKKVKPVMNDMLPKEEDETSVKKMEDMTMEEYMQAKLAKANPRGESAMIDEKDEYAESIPEKKDVVDSDRDGEDTDELDENEEMTIDAMRTEIKNKVKEKNSSSEITTESDAKKEKKAFFSAFSLGKNKKEVSTEKNEDMDKEEESEGLATDERRAIEKKANRDHLIVAFLVFVIMSTIGATAFYFYVQYRKPGMVPNVSLSSVEQAKKDADETKRIVGEAIELPDDEEPILATVTDVKKVKNQKFFAKAQNGDRVLIYTINKKAILFRPSTNKIIEVSQVSGLNSDSSDNSAKQAEESEVAANEQKNKTNIDSEKEKEDEMIKVAVYNGSKTRGLAQKIGDMVTLIPGTAITEKTNAKKEYEKTVVIDLSGNQEDMAKRIAESITADIVEFPEGENKPDADILIIGGSSFKLTE
ncbi:MAG TPA: hypothetical protein DIC35_03040 [Candidatus Moranbacteria bacterium]|nr:hypothetical protein [Candidatus Moranbacteria bacterium]